MAKKVKMIIGAMNGNPATPNPPKNGKYIVIKNGEKVTLNEKEFDSYKNSPEFQEKLAKSRGMNIDRSIAEKDLTNSGGVVNKANTQGYLNQKGESFKSSLDKKRAVEEEALNAKRASVGKSPAKVIY